jgi:hypothetical protein
VNCRIPSDINLKSVIEKISVKGFTRGLHPRYSPDLSPSDFSAFGITKAKMKDCHFQNPKAISEKFMEEAMCADGVQPILGTAVE